jgi:hypothetical protein
MSDPFEAFAPLLGKTWKGAFASSTPEKPVVDVVRWERILNGQAVRSLHSINEGQYGGETVFLQDARTRGIIYFYFTTAGYYTQGTLSFQEGKIVSRETVNGDEDGVTEVQSVAEILPDGRLHTQARYLREGKWEAGHEVFYEEDPGAEVKFKPA